MKKIILILFIFLLSIEAVSAVSLSEIESDFHSFQEKHKYSFNSRDLVKIHENASQFEIQILYEGHPVAANENVSFLVNGISYVRQTNSDGVASLNINLEPGKYVVVSEYNSCRNYNNILVME